jgi:pilus assembly protein TadC
MEPILASLLAAMCAVFAVLWIRSLGRVPAGLAGLDAGLRSLPVERRRGSIRRLMRLLGSGGWVRLAGAGAAVTVLTLPWPAPALAPILLIAGARLPAFLGARRRGAYRRAVDAEIPQFLDLLAAASLAGLSAPLAVRRAADAIRDPLATELERVLQAIDLGARWRDELHALAERLELPDLRRTVAALTRTETLGSSLTASMTELAGRVREARRAEVTERARIAPVKMLFPLVFLVLPAFLLLTVVPVLLTTLQSIR